ncbi:MAG: hypothetical protein C4534_01575 [Gaiellales bacterium]|nr:MAG: hypothetical protein C4534_01575 [Gaiellales bacterium]
MSDLPPALYNREAEHKVAGSALLSSDAALKVASLPDELFHTRLIRDAVLPAIRKLIGSGVTPTPDVVLREIVEAGQDGNADVHGFVTDMVAGVESPELVDYYCDVLRDLAVLRRFRRLLNKLERREDGPPLETITREVERAASLLGTNRSLRLLADAAEHLEQMNEPPVVKTGIHGLDDYLQIRNGHLVFIAATPGVGKTSLAVQMSALAAENGLKVLFVSLEMSAEEIARRVAARAGLTEPQAIREYLRGMEIYYETTHTPGGVREHVRSIEPDMVVVDYIGLMSADNNHKNASRVNELATISRSLKVIARTADCPVIVMSQLNRQAAPNEKGVARPQLHHLRDSGALEADADAVLLLHDDNDEKHVTLAKNRHGPVGTWETVFDPVRCTFR